MKPDFNKVLVTGAGGMVGSYIDFGIKLQKKDLDITKADAVLEAAQKYKPEIILHLAAETDVDKCERDPTHAYLVNAVGTYNLALAARAVGAKMIYISTAGVFDGTKDGAYCAEDTPNPKNHYGHSKLLGEFAVRSLVQDYLIIRVCWMMGGGLKGDKKFVAKIMRQLYSPEIAEIKAVTDQIGSPTYAKDLVGAIKILIKSGAIGTMHLPNQNTASRYDVAKFIAGRFRPEVKVIGVPTSYFQLDAKRTANESLAASTNLMRPWQDALKEYLEEEWRDLSVRNDCRACKKTRLKEVLDFGEMPLANAFIKQSDFDKRERIFPLKVYVCEDCHLLQLRHVVKPEILFKDYSYLTSASSYLAEHFKAMGCMLADKFLNSQNDLVVEIGGNDGTLLGAIKKRCRVLNIEPVPEIAAISRKNGVETINKFFDSEVSNEILQKYGLAKVVTANNVMAHIDNLDDVFSGVKKMIGRDGVFVFEAHWVGNLLGEGGFDQIYHEHLCYYSLTSLMRLAERIGLSIFDIETVPVHGESIRVYMFAGKSISASVRNFLDREASMGLNKMETYMRFGERVLRNKKELNTLLAGFRKNGKRIVGYGAPAKGNTLLNYCGINTDTIDFITDTTPLKQGLYAPGSRIPVYAPSKLLERSSAPPDYVLLLAWNYADAILEKESDLRKRGVKFILPVPEPRVV